MTTTTLSRRRLLASVPAVAATMAPAAAKSLTGLPASPDAELLELGRKLAPLAAELNAARALDRQRVADHDAKLKAMGLKDESDYPDSGAYMDERFRLCDLLRADEDEDGIPLDFDRMHDGVLALLDEIQQYVPTTLEGFKVLIFAMMTCHDDLCDAEQHLCGGEAEFWQICCEFAGDRRSPA